jgi:hypothetical protein
MHGNMNLKFQTFSITLSVKYAYAEKKLLKWLNEMTSFCLLDSIELSFITLNLERKGPLIRRKFKHYLELSV